MIQILQLKGTEAKLYKLVAPLVMDPKVLRMNYNFPFRTSEKFVWFVALNGNKVLGFVPVEQKRIECVINNYYTENKDKEVLRLLLENVLDAMKQQLLISAISFLEDAEMFAQLGFKEEKRWTRYVKMIKERKQDE